MFSIFGIALGLSAAIVACSGDDDDNKAPATTSSAQGESCTRTADCASGLVCLDNVCEKKATNAAGGNAGNEGVGGSTGGTGAKGGTGGTGGTTAGTAGKGGSGGSTSTPAPVLGGEGESCTRAADCETGLHCFNQRCVSTEVMGAGGEAGGTSNPPPSVRLGEQGETCSLSSDCAEGLACIPAPPDGLIGVCSVVNSGITPTGKDCHAECTQPSDCCELPPSVLTQFSISSCADLANLLTGVDCKNAPGANAPECFVQATYCQCNTDSWDCTDQGRCIYVADCSASGFTTDGCPSVSRSDLALVSTCTDGTCGAPPATPVCSKDADCLNKAVHDTTTGDTCSDGECVCYRPEGNCYRQCFGDLDCAKDKVCDGKTHVCVAAPECSDDVTCQTKNHTIKSICVAGSCKTDCDTDADCNSLTGSLTQVCGADHTCQAIGCSADSDCTSSTVHMFCTDVLAGGGGTAVSSAITQGGTQ